MSGTTDLEWKVVYVGSAESEKFDQTLDSVLVGPVPVGVNKFVFQVSFLFCNSFFNVYLGLIHKISLSHTRYHTKQRT